MSRRKAEPSFRDSRYRGLEFGLRLVRKGRRYGSVQIPDSYHAYRFMRELAQESSEHLYQLNLNGGHELTGVYLMGKGGLNRCVCDPRESFKAALLGNSSAILLVHNHPSGCVEPSAEDIASARRIKEGGALLGISLLDSIIIGNERYCSLAERSLLG